jgi:hypothetical protein
LRSSFSLRTLRYSTPSSRRTIRMLSQM